LIASPSRRGAVVGEGRTASISGSLAGVWFSPGQLTWREGTASRAFREEGYRRRVRPRIGGHQTEEEEWKMAEVSELKQFDLFKGFSEKQLSQLAQLTSKKNYGKGQVIYNEGDPAKHVFVVDKGLVSLRRVEPGKLVGIAFENRDRGELFGTAAVMQPREYTLTALCLEETEVYAIDADKLGKICELDPQLGYKFMSAIAQVYFERYKSAKRQLYQMVQTPALITALPG